MDYLNFSWVVENEVAGHAEPCSHNDLDWLYQRGIRALVRMATNPVLPTSRVADSGMDDLPVPVTNGTAPSQEVLSRIIGFIDNCVNTGKPVGVSCFAGLGRTGTVLACYYAKRYNIRNQKVAINEIRGKRPGSIESPEQEKAVSEYILKTVMDLRIRKSSR